MGGLAFRGSAWIAMTFCRFSKDTCDPEGLKTSKPIEGWLGFTTGSFGAWKKVHKSSYQMVVKFAWWCMSMVDRKIPLKKTSTQKELVGGFNPFEKYWSKWESSPNRGENKKYLKPPPRETLKKNTSAMGGKFPSHGSNSPESFALFHSNNSKGPSAWMVTIRFRLRPATWKWFTLACQRLAQKPMGFFKVDLLGG